MWEVCLPTSVNLSAKKKFALNLNIYRNAHFHTLNNAKSIFQDQVGSLVKHIPLQECVGIIYTYFSGTKRESDVSNICTVVDKFFCDTLVEVGVLQDDNFNHVKEVAFRYGGISKGNSHVMARIIPLER